MNQSSEQDKLLAALSKTERTASKSKWMRFWENPVRYSIAIGHRTLVYPFTKNEIRTRKQTFYGLPVQLSLPASTDIYLTGGKSHDSELRLAKYLIRHLPKGSVFMDIGAHIGYFSLLASILVSPKGKVFSLEPGSESYMLLSKNTKKYNHITPIQKAVTHNYGVQKFYEFPAKYAEYNSFDVDQYRNEDWFARSGVVTVTVDTTNLDTFVENWNAYPDFIKMDVEGAEDQVIQGGESFLTDHAPVIIMEFLAPDRRNEPHHRARNLLKNHGYHTYFIDQEGDLSFCEDPDEHLKSKKLDSDNLVFMKTKIS